MGKIKRPIPVDEVVPHKPPMSLLRHVIAHDTETTVCDIRIETASVFCENGRVDSWVGLEYMAQAVAAHAGMESRQRGEHPEIGFLLGTRQANLMTKSYRLGQTLHVAVRRVWGEGQLFSFDCSIMDAVNGKCLAKALLNVFRPADLDRFLKRGTYEA